MSEEKQEHKYDVFISYSRKDLEFARKLQRALANYTPPRDLPVPQRRLRVFRDESDFQGPEYQSALAAYLRSSAKLLVVCSPHSRASGYVGEEIRTFAELRGKQHLVSVLLDGTPDNDAQERPESERAFHPQLLALLSIPLASDYRGFNPRKDRVEKDRFESSWYKTLADVYVDYGVDRSLLEQREKIRQRRTRRRRASAVSVLIVVLASLTTWALLSRQEAIKRGNIAQSRWLAAQSTSRTHPFDVELLLAVEAFRVAPTAQAWEALLLALEHQTAIQQFLHGHSAAITQTHFSEDGRCAATAAEDNTIIVWDVGQGRALARLHDPVRQASALAFGRTCALLITGFNDGVLTAWRLGSVAAQQFSIRDGAAAITAVTVSPDENHVVVGTATGRVSLHESTTGAVLVGVQDGHPAAVTALQFNQQERVLVSIDQAATIRRWVDNTLVARGYPITCRGDVNDVVVLSRDMSHCAVGGFGPGITVSHLHYPDSPTMQISRGGYVFALAFSHDGKILAIGGQGGEIQLWDLENNRKMAELVEHRADVLSLAFSPDDSRIISGARDGSIIVWGMRTSRRIVQEIPGKSGIVTSAALDAELRMLASGTMQSELVLSELDGSTHATRIIEKLRESIKDIRFSPHRKEVFAVDQSDTVISWEIESNRRRVFYPGRGRAVEKLDVDSEGSHMAGIDSAHNITLWDLRTGAPATILALPPEAQQPPGLGIGVALASGGRRLASIHFNQAVMWNLVKGTYHATSLPVSTLSYFKTLVFSTDGRMLALGKGLDDGAIALVETGSTRVEVADLPRQQLLEVTALAFNPNGDLLVSGHMAGEISLWDVVGRRRIGNAYQARQEILSVRFARDGKSFAAVTSEGNVVLWNLDASSWTGIACHVANRNLTQKELRLYFGADERKPSCGNPGGAPPG